MKRYLTISVFLFAAVSSFASGQTVRQEIDAIYKIWTNCMSGGSMQAALDTIDASYYSVDATGAVTYKSDMVSQMKSMKDMMRKCTVKITIEQISESKGEVCVWVKLVAKGEMKQGNKWVPFDFTSKVVESLKRTPSGLKFIYTQHLPS